MRTAFVLFSLLALGTVAAEPNPAPANAYGTLLVCDNGSAKSYVQISLATDAPALKAALKAGQNFSVTIPTPGVGLVELTQSSGRTWMVRETNDRGTPVECIFPTAPARP